MTEPIPDPEVTRFLAVSAARLAPRTVEAYRRDLIAFGNWFVKPLADGAARGARALPRRATRAGPRGHDDRAPAGRAALLSPPPGPDRRAPGQPGRRGRPSATDAAAAAHALARRGGAAGRGRAGNDAAGLARPRPRRAPVRRRPARQRGGRARARRRRPRRAPRPLHRQGRQGADRPARAPAPSTRFAATWPAAGRSSTAATGPSSS